MIGKIYSQKVLPSIGTGRPGSQLSHQPWRYLKDEWIRFSGGPGSAGSRVGFHVLGGLFLKLWL